MTKPFEPAHPAVMDDFEGCGTWTMSDGLLRRHQREYIRMWGIGKRISRTRLKHVRMSRKRIMGAAESIAQLRIIFEDDSDAHSFSLRRAK